MRPQPHTSNNSTTYATIFRIMSASGNNNNNPAAVSPEVVRVQRAPNQRDQMGIFDEILSFGDNVVLNQIQQSADTLRLTLESNNVEWALKCIQDLVGYLKVGESIANRIQIMHAYQFQVLVTGALHDLYHAMLQFIANRDIQSYGIVLYLAILDDNDDMVNIVKVNKGVRAIVNALKNYPFCLEINKPGYDALFRLCEYKDMAETIFRLKTFGLVTDALSTFRQHESIAIHCCGLLSKFINMEYEGVVVSNMQMREAILALIESMKYFDYTMDVQYKCLYAIATVCSVEHGATTVMNEEGVTLIIKAVLNAAKNNWDLMEEDSNNVEVARALNNGNNEIVKEGCRALKNMMSHEATVESVATDEIDHHLAKMLSDCTSLRPNTRGAITELLYEINDYMHKNSSEYESEEE